jgi:RNA polymerase sigma-70 factor (ECF subfamily)
MRSSSGSCSRIAQSGKPGLDCVTRRTQGTGLTCERYCDPDTSKDNACGKICNGWASLTDRSGAEVGGICRAPWPTALEAFTRAARPCVCALSVRCGALSSLFFRHHDRVVKAEEGRSISVQRCKILRAHRESRDAGDRRFRGAGTGEETMSSASIGASRRIDEASFRLAYREHHRYVRNLARRAGIPEPELDDVVQDVFIVLHRRWHDLECPLRARPWIHSVSVRVCANHRRTTRRSRAQEREPLERDDIVAPLGLVPEQQVIRREEYGLLVLAFARLKGKQRQLLVLRELEERSAKELAAMSGTSPRTVASRLRAARRALRRALRAYGAPWRAKGPLFRNLCTLESLP